LKRRRITHPHRGFFPTPATLATLTTTFTPAQPDITQARAILGWEPKVQLEAGLKKTIEYFAQSL
jgi:nucleoside-diphosphate-sugar epimerase